MRGTTRAAFLVLILAGVFFMNTPANAAYGCEAFGDLTMGTMYENCYPDDPWFCFDGDNYCWQISPGFSCENAWYGICWDNDNPCEYNCCCRRY